MIQKLLYKDHHSGLDLACPVLDTGESSLFNWIPAGVYPVLDTGRE